MKGYVYFGLPGIKSQYVKIGHTRDYKKRLKDLGLIPVLLVEVDDPLAVERQIHKRFSNSREKGEWFRVSLEIMHVVCSAYYRDEWPYGGRVLKRA